MVELNLFSSWKEGLLYLALGLLVPIVPVVVYFIIGSSSNTYFYVLLLATCVPLLYDLLKTKIEGTKLIIEQAIMCVALFAIAIFSFLLLLIHSQTTEQFVVSWKEITLSAIFAIPVLTVFLEFILCIIRDIKIGKNTDASSLVRGGGKV